MINSWTPLVIGGNDERKRFSFREVTTAPAYIGAARARTRYGASLLRFQVSPARS